MMGNEHDDWEVAVDTGEFDKRLELLEKERAATQESLPSSTFSTAKDASNRNLSTTNSNQSYKPIRILKRPTASSQTPVNNDFPNSNPISSVNNANSPFPDDTSSSSTTASRHPSRESTNSTPSTKPTIKTYEQREQEYRLARLRIMGEEVSSAKDDDDDDDSRPPESNTTTAPANNSNTSSTLNSSRQQSSSGANPVSS